MQRGAFDAQTDRQFLAAIVALRARAETAEKFIRVDLTKPEDYQRLEAEVVVLREALRAYAIKITPLGEYKFVYECVQCGDHSWRENEPERHAPGCLAEKDKGG